LGGTRGLGGFHLEILPVHTPQGRLPRREKHQNFRSRPWREEAAPVRAYLL
jgi:hypothetical protein